MNHNGTFFYGFINYHIIALLLSRKPSVFGQRKDQRRFNSTFTRSQDEFLQTLGGSWFVNHTGRPELEKNVTILDGQTSAVG